MVFKEVMLVMSTSQFWTTVGFAFGGFAILFTILIVLVTLFSTPKKPFLYLPKDATFVRELGYTERILYLAHEGLGAYWQCQTSRLRGPLTPEIVLEALKILQKRHPQLSWGLHSSGPMPRDPITTANQVPAHLFFHQYDKPDQHIRFTVVKRKDDQHWREFHQSVLDKERPFRLGGPSNLLWRCQFLYAEDGNEHDIVFQFSHSIVDGTSRMVLTSDLLKVCELLITKNEAALNLMSQPPALKHETQEELCKSSLNSSRTIAERIFPVWLVTLIDFLIGHKYEIPLSERAPQSQRKEEFLTATISEHHLTAFLKLCRLHKISFNSAFSVLVSKHIGKQFGMKDNVCLYIPVSMRQRYCEPAVKSNVLGCYVASIYAYGPITSDSNPYWQNAKKFHNNEVNKNFDQRTLTALKANEGMLKLVSLMFNHVANDPKTCERGGAALISNLGALEFKKHYGPIEWRANWVGHGQKRWGTNCAFFIHTIENECSISFQWTSPLMNSDKARLVFEGILHDIAHPDNL